MNSKQSSSSPRSDEDQKFSPTDETPADVATSSLEDVLAEANWEQRLAEAEERVLRAQADFENFRKRIRREQEDERRFAALPLIRDLLPVLDNFERALQALPEDAPANLRSGIEMVSRQLQDTLRQHHCLTIDAVGQPFDPSLHEAVGKEAAADVPEGHVAKVHQPGYRLHERVVRPAYVVVASRPSA